VTDITLCASKKIEVTNFVSRSWRVDSYLRMCSEGTEYEPDFFVYTSHFGNARRIS
jgi:hypothetical protein